MHAVKHFHDLEASVADVDRIFCFLGGSTPALFDFSEMPKEVADVVLRLRPCTLGQRWKRAVRCRVNGDGYWYWRQWLVCDGAVVGSVAAGGGGEL